VHVSTRDTCRIIGRESEKFKFNLMTSFVRSQRAIAVDPRFEPRPVGGVVLR